MMNLTDVGLETNHIRITVRFYMESSSGLIKPVSVILGYFFKLISIDNKF